MCLFGDVLYFLGWCAYGKPHLPMLTFSRLLLSVLACLTLSSCALLKIPFQILQGLAGAATGLVGEPAPKPIRFEKAEFDKSRDYLAPAGYPAPPSAPAAPRLAAQ